MTQAFPLRMTDPIQIMEAIAERHPNMRVSRALGEIKHELRRQAVLDELRSTRPTVAERNALSTIASKLKALAVKMERIG